VLLPVALEARSELVGVHDSLGYEGALPGTTQASWCSSAESGGHQELSRARYPAQQAKQSADVDAREEIVRPIASLTRSPCT
jgi:hypothetical protein